MTPLHRTLHHAFLLGVLVTVGAPAGASAAVVTLPEHACEGDDERWVYGREIPESARAIINEATSDGSDPWKNYRLGMELKEMSGIAEAKAFGDYLMARAFVQGKQWHLAWDAFQTIVGAELKNGQLGIHYASFACLHQLQSKLKGLKWRPEVKVNFGKLPMALIPSEKREPMHGLALSMLADVLGVAPLDENAVSGILSVLAGAGLYETYAKGWIELKRGNYNGSIEEFRKIINVEHPPTWIAQSMDVLLLTQARSLYTLRKFNEAADMFRKVPKESNFLSQALSDLAWSLLMAKNTKEAIGTAYNLQRSLLSKVFAPEAPMIMAIALNEVCQFSQAIQAVGFFRKKYRPIYGWLYQWHQKKEADLYSELVGYLGGKKNVPDVIANEWLRSPVFISSQEEINALKDEKAGVAKLLRRAIADGKGIRTELANLQKAGAGGARLQKGGRGQSDQLRLRLTRAQARQRAWQEWDRKLRAFHASVATREAGLVSVINSELGHKNDRMIEMILQVTENTELVEIEIYDGASEDIVWQNVHPDYKAITKKFKDETKKKSKAVWNWGKVSSSDAEDSELWEDELGWFSGAVDDECSNKNKYLAIKAKE